MAIKKEIDWDEGIIDLMPEEKRIRLIKKFKKAVLSAKKTPEGRKKLAGAFSGKPSDYKSNVG
jgi:hypothetical protein